MKELLDKISSYNLFNYLFPGILFVIILEKVSQFSLIQQNIVLGVFLYYFVGLVISRIGSILVEPILKKISFIKFTDYQDFVETSQKDEKINQLSETNNMYRTLVALFLAVLLIRPFELLYINYPKTITYLLPLALLILFLSAYRKQTNYVSKRVDCNKE